MRNRPSHLPQRPSVPLGTGWGGGDERPEPQDGEKEGGLNYG